MPTPKIPGLIPLKMQSLILPRAHGHSHDDEDRENEGDLVMAASKVTRNQSTI